MTGQAEQRNKLLDEQAARRRQEVENDFEIAMAARRAEAMRALAERRASAEAETKRMLEEAGEQTRAMLDEARREVAALREVRDRMAAQLDGAGRLLAEARPLLRSMQGDSAEPPAEEDPPPNGTRPARATKGTRPAKRRAPAGGGSQRSR